MKIGNKNACTGYLKNKALKSFGKGRLVAQYKFNKSIFEDLVPEFNSEFIEYEIIDEYLDMEDDIVTRSIYSLQKNVYPTMVMFGSIEKRDREKSLLTIEYLKVTDKFVTMENMFSNCCNLSWIYGIDSWDTSNVVNMKRMFYYCKSLAVLDLNNFKTSNVTSMKDMFNRCISLNTLKISNWDTSKVTDMSAMFSGCKLLEEVDVSNFDTSKVDNMEVMFFSCSSLKELNINGFDTSNVTNMRAMFNSCEELIELDVSNWNVTKVTNMKDLFCRCYNLKTIEGLSKWNVSNVTTMWSMFSHCYKLQNLGNISRWNVSKVVTMSHMFNECKSLSTIDIQRWKPTNVKDVNSMFSKCVLLSSLKLCNFNENVNMLNIFNYCDKLKSVVVPTSILIDRIAPHLPVRKTAGYVSMVIGKYVGKMNNELNSKNWRIK